MSVLPLKLLRPGCVSTLHTIEGRQDPLNNEQVGAPACQGPVNRVDGVVRSYLGPLSWGRAHDGAPAQLRRGSLTHTSGVAVADMSLE